jgi:hypothetical protein
VSLFDQYFPLDIPGSFVDHVLPGAYPSVSRSLASGDHFYSRITFDVNETAVGNADHSI